MGKLKFGGSFGKGLRLSRKLSKGIGSITNNPKRPRSLRGRPSSGMLKSLTNIPPYKPALQDKKIDLSVGVDTLQRSHNVVTAGKYSKMTR